jgi:hypothetical protein
MPLGYTGGSIVFLLLTSLFFAIIYQDTPVSA